MHLRGESTLTALALDWTARLDRCTKARGQEETKYEMPARTATTSTRI